MFLQSKSRQIKTQKSGYVTKSEWQRLLKANSKYTLKKKRKKYLQFLVQTKGSYPYSIKPTTSLRPVATREKMGKETEHDVH